MTELEREQHIEAYQQASRNHKHYRLCDNISIKEAETQAGGLLNHGLVRTVQQRIKLGQVETLGSMFALDKCTLDIKVEGMRLL